MKLVLKSVQLSRRSVGRVTNVWLHSTAESKEPFPAGDTESANIVCLNHLEWGDVACASGDTPEAENFVETALNFQEALTRRFTHCNSTIDKHFFPCLVDKRCVARSFVENRSSI